jgi:hypothetical protein
MRRLLLLTLLAAACGDPKPGAAGPAAAAPSAPVADGAAQESALLGREIFGVMDRVLAYRSSHFNNLPKDLPAAGIDSLTRTTIRRLSISGPLPTVTVVFRNPAGHALRGCSGSSRVIEDSMLNGGAFDVQCTTAAGETQDFRVGG